MRELASVARSMARFWLVIFPIARAQLREWERAATAIPDPQLRGLALATLDSEGFSAMGAALVATTVDRPGPALIRLLVAVQIAWDYIDTLAEQPAIDPLANGIQLHRALIDAVGVDPPRDDYYRLHPAHDDGGYLTALVAHCQDAGTSLPSLACVRDAAVRELERAEVQYLNHAPPAVRVPALRRWADAQDVEGAGWIELAAAASSSLGVLALLALAADPATTERTVDRVRAAYVPWVDALTALLDSLVDGPADAAAGLLNWVAHYPSEAAMTTRLRQVTERSVGAARRLPNGDRHLLIVVGMIAMHLSQPTAWLPGVQPATRAVLRATDTVVMPFVYLLLRAWRQARSERERWCR